MAKFNKTNTIKTENRSGHAAYSMSRKEQLMAAVVATMFDWILEIRYSFHCQLRSFSG